MKKTPSFQDDCWRSESAETRWTLKTPWNCQASVGYISMLLSVCGDYSMCVYIWGCCCVPSRQTSSRWKAKCGWLLMRQTKKGRRIHLFWYTDQWWLVFLPVLHFHENQTNLFSKHAWQPVLENTQKWPPHKQTNKQTNTNLVCSEKDGWQKKTNPQKSEMSRILVTCASTCVWDLVCVCVYYALAQLNVCLHADMVHVPLRLSAVLTPAHLIDCTESELIRPGGREPTHGNLCHSRIHLR